MSVPVRKIPFQENQPPQDRSRLHPVSSEKASSHQGLDPYVYTPLSTDRSIRLIVFHEDHSYGYSCSLAEFELDEAPPFHALSYTWGNPFQLPRLEDEDDSTKDKAYWEKEYAQEHIFKVDGKALVIEPGHNLDLALHQLWNAEYPLMESRYFWVDAICINQKDYLERTAQILIMGDLYKIATKVIAWLGVELPLSHRAFKALEDLGKIPEETWDQLQFLVPESEEYSAIWGVELPLKADMESLAGFMARSWFHRVWVLQEAVFAQELVLVCGNRAIWPQTLSAMSLRISSAIHWFMGGDLGLREGRFEVPSEFFGTIEYLQKIVTSPEAVAPSEIMCYTLELQAKEPTDTVYGVLNLLAAAMNQNSRDLLVQPDMSKSMDEVIESTTRMMIEHDGDLGILDHVRPYSFRDIDKRPSWAIDWRVPQKPARFPEQITSSWQPSGDLPRQRPDLSIPQRLWFSAAKLTTITAMTLETEQLISDVTLMNAWLQFVLGMAGKPYGSSIDQGWTEILWRTMIADQTEMEISVPSNMEDAFVIFFTMWSILYSADSDFFSSVTSFMDCIERIHEVDPKSILLPLDELREGINYLDGLLTADPDSSSEELWEAIRISTSKRFPSCEKDTLHLRSNIFSGAVKDLMYGRCLARTENNLLASVPASVKVGDSVWIVPGLQTPFVMREIGDGEMVHVGEAYVHGAMYGEFAERLVYQDVLLR